MCLHKMPFFLVAPRQQEYLLLVGYNTSKPHTELFWTLKHVEEKFKKLKRAVELICG